jgi:hypothetical protein
MAARQLKILTNIHNALTPDERENDVVRTMIAEPYEEQLLAHPIVPTRFKKNFPEFDDLREANFLERPNSDLDKETKVKIRKERDVEYADPANNPVPFNPPSAQNLVGPGHGNMVSAATSASYTLSVHNNQLQQAYTQREFCRKQYERVFDTHVADDNQMLIDAKANLEAAENNYNEAKKVTRLARRNFLLRLPPEYNQRLSDQIIAYRAEFSDYDNAVSNKMTPPRKLKMLERRLLKREQVLAAAVIDKNGNLVDPNAINIETLPHVPQSAYKRLKDEPEK